MSNDPTTTSTRVAAPRRPPIPTHPNMQHLAADLVGIAPAVDLARKLISAELADLGIPSAGESRAATACADHDDPDRCTCRHVDYSDPTGEMASAWHRLNDDLEALQDGERAIRHQHTVIARIARHSVTQAEYADPLCEVCNAATVEATDARRSKFRRLQRVGSYFTRDAGPRAPRAMCSACRKRSERSGRAAA